MGYKKQRKALWVKQGGKCYYCGGLMINRSCSSLEMPYRNNAATVDHWLPKAILIPEVVDYMSQHGISNLVLAHLACNIRKGKTIPSEWKEEIGPYRFTQNGWIWIGENNDP